MQRLFVIYTTSPCREWWPRLHKTVRKTVVAMNPWSRAECESTLDFAKCCTDMDDIFDRLGPTPRLCFDILSDSNDLAEYETDLSEAFCIHHPT